jgi:hypothetical protein
VAQRRNMRCSNCQVQDDTVAYWSFDLDLPKIRLCRICSYLIVADPDMFDELTKPPPQEST